MVSGSVSLADTQEDGLAEEDAPSLEVTNTELVSSHRGVNKLEGRILSIDTAFIWNVSLSFVKHGA